ncbi:MAG: choice-of-anchor L domain-containing protein, partial [Bacteroidetes bacterium]|nr:choice-of-anchor L domain-containing protein [Bacteroidota bacterium]
NSVKYYLYISFLLVNFVGFSQLFTNVGQSPTSLVQNVLLGGGVSISNVTYSGSSTALGSFTTGNSNLGLNSGIVLTTGTVLNTGQGPHGPNNIDNAGIDNGFPGSPLLSSQIPGNPSTFNAATLEFDLVPYSDSVVFRYVFGSEEYPEFVGSKFNDVFGFFISGPGIVGQRNIALTPNTSQVVSINNVNGNSNAQLYVSNAGGSSIQYDGFTRVLTASSKVICGQTYHLKIAIADVNDGIYDSGIFLAANSLSSRKTVDVSAELSYKAYADPLTMAEGCVSATVTVKRSRNIQTTLIVPISTSGTAQANIDYSPAVPSLITFNPGETTKTFVINALTDGLIEGIENILMTFNVNDPCGNPAPITQELKIADIEPVAVSVEDTTVLCPGDEVKLQAIPSGGVGPYTFLWNDGSGLSSLTVAPNVTTNYNVTVTDNCLKESASASATVTVPQYLPVQLTTDGDEVVLCPFIEDTISAIASGGTGNYSYKWFDGNLQISSDDTAYVAPPFTKTYMVVAIDGCNQSDTAYLNYTVTSPPLELTTSASPTICPGEIIDISVFASGGFGNYYYDWRHSGETTSQVSVQPFTSRWYSVGVSDDCQTFTFYDSIFVKVVKPTANFEISSKTVYEKIPITFKNTSINAAFYVWDFGDGQSSTLIHPNNTYANSGFYDVMLIAEDLKGCLDTLIKSVQILEENYVYIPNSFTPDGDRFNNHFEASTIGVLQFNIRIYDRWGRLMFESNDPNFSWDGTNQQNEKLKQDVYNYIVTFSTLYELDTVKQGFVTLLK